MERVNLAERTRRLIAIDDREALEKARRKLTKLRGRKRAHDQLSRGIRGLGEAGARLLEEKGLSGAAQKHRRLTQEVKPKTRQLNRRILVTGHRLKQSRAATRERGRRWGRRY